MPPQRRAYRSLLPPRRARRPRRAKLAWATTSARQTLRPPVGVRTPRPHTCTRPERRLHGNNRRGPHIASTPRPRGQAQNPTAATLSQIKFFHSMWTNLFAVAGTRVHPPAGVIRKRGRSAPSCAQCGRAGRIPAHEVRAHLRPVGPTPPLGAQCAPLRRSPVGAVPARRKRAPPSAKQAKSFHKGAIPF